MQANLLKLTSLLSIFAAITVLGSTAAKADKIDLYLSAPKSGTSPYTNTTVETFESLTAGTYTTPYVSSIGTYAVSSTNKMAIVNDNQYSAGTGKYMAIGSQSGSTSLTLNFNAPQAYFGFSWNAGDTNNNLSFYRGSELLGTYSTATILSKLSASTVTAIDGNTYNSSQYKGQPVTGQNTGEPYAFINIINTNGTFDRIVFTNNGTGTGFETDNHTIRTGTTTPNGTFVPVGSATTPSVPEAGTVTLLGIGLSTLGMVAIRRRK